MLDEIVKALTAVWLTVQIIDKLRTFHKHK